MITIDAKVVVDRPVDEVFAFVTDLRNDVRWWPGIRRAERIRGDGGTGTVYRLWARLLWFDGPWDIEVIASEPPHSQTIACKGPLSYICRYDFAPGTSLRLRIDITAARSLSWLAPVLRFIVWRNLRRLDRVLAG